MANNWKKGGLKQIADVLMNIPQPSRIDIGQSKIFVVGGNDKEQLDELREWCLANLTPEQLMLYRLRFQGGSDGK